jgi:CRISPR-associated protein Csd1
MILQQLASYYGRLVESGDDSLVIPGFSLQNVTFRIELELDGTLVMISDARNATGKKPVPTKMQLLGSSKPSGQGINPCFLWDNTAYTLGFKLKDEKPERTRQAFEAFRDKHIAFKPEIDEPEFDAVCEFLKKWDPEKANDFPILEDVATGFGVFHIVGQTHDVHKNKKIEAWWKKQIALASPNEPDSNFMQCLITGVSSKIARIHDPKIKGVNGAQSSGALLVSFNFDAAESYGREQSFVAPVSEDAAFRYSVALNRLLDGANKRRIQIADATTVFWTDQQAPIEEILPGLVDPGSVEDEGLNAKLKSILGRLSRGQPAPELGAEDTEFFVLGLSPNAARISVRFWWRGTIGEVSDRFGMHYSDLAISKPKDSPEFPSIWQILRETARESKDIAPNLSGAILRSILVGAEYPTILFQSLIRRTKVDRNINSIRAAGIKACLNRSFRFGNFQSPLTSELEMVLNPNRPEASYQLGRLFAVIEKTQNDAFKGSLNTTIKDRFFSAASATPAAVFPRLIRMNQHHSAKLEIKSHQICAEKRMQEIISKLDGFPSHLSMADQGLFAIGYYHQRQDFFTKKEDSQEEL